MACGSVFCRDAGAVVTVSMPAFLRFRGIKIEAWYRHVEISEIRYKAMMRAML